MLACNASVLPLVDVHWAERLMANKVAMHLQREVQESHQYLTARYNNALQQITMRAYHRSQVVLLSESNVGEKAPGSLDKSSKSSWALPSILGQQSCCAALAVLNLVEQEQ